MRNRRKSSAGGSFAEPMFDDLRKSLKFSPQTAQIWLGGRRMVLADSNELTILRRELIMSIGQDRARGVLTRMGYEVGAAEAHFALRLRKGRSFFDGFAAGPQLHALRGMVRVTPVKFEADVQAGRFRAEYVWTHSIECQGHLKQFGAGHVPGGWSQLGYASGYASAYLGRPVAYREVECIAMGHPRCFLIGELLDEWTGTASELRYFRAENYIAGQDRPASKPVAQVADSNAGDRDMVGASTGFNVALHLLDRVAQTDATVLFLGESGVGKEVFARELHKRSRRASRPLVCVNCASLPESLVEAELFGVERGAFTGATVSRPGRFERASGGTLFLDEVGTLTGAAQSKLLRVIQDHQFERVGDTKVRCADVRIIAATNADLRAAIRQGTFREDLYHRLNTFPIHLPPLRERPADVPLLVNHFLRRFCEQYQRNVPGFTEEALRYFITYSWPGNVRELENIIERGVILADDAAPIDLHHLLVATGPLDERTVPPQISSAPQTADSAHNASAGDWMLDRGMTVRGATEALVKSALARAGGNKAAAARLAGLTRSQVNYWMKVRQRQR